jgi:WD40 repeat protein
VALDASGCLGVIEQHDSPVQSVAFSPAGNLLASGSKDGTARIWRIDDGRKFDRTLLQRLLVLLFSVVREWGQTNEASLA